VILVDGGWGGALADGGDADPSVAASVSAALGLLVIPPLVTALHVAVVQALARGEEPTVGVAPPPGDWIAPEQPERPILPPRI
jgi:hypothetical protein